MTLKGSVKVTNTYFLYLLPLLLPLSVSKLFQLYINDHSEPAMVSRPRSPAPVARSLPWITAMNTVTTQVLSPTH